MFLGPLLDTVDVSIFLAVLQMFRDMAAGLFLVEGSAYYIQ